MKDNEHTGPIGSTGPDPLPRIGKIRVVLDTDTYNEIDDQFALAYAALSLERIGLEAVYAAPFHNERSNGPADGMHKSYAEIGRVLDRVGIRSDDLALRGSTRWFDPTRPQSSDAVDDLIARARIADETLYVVGIAAATNLATAIALAPDITDKIVVVWLGGNPSWWHDPLEFNLCQDAPAARFLYGCGVRLVRIPCMNVAQHLNTTLAEMEQYVRGRGPLGDYLCRIFAEYYASHYGRSKVIWDIATIGYLIDPAWLPSRMILSPILDEALNCVGSYKHVIREAYFVDRDAVFGDFFRKIERFATCGERKGANDECAVSSR